MIKLEFQEYEARKIVNVHKESVAEIYKVRGEAGLRELPGIGKGLTRQIARWLHEIKSSSIA